MYSLVLMAAMTGAGQTEATFVRSRIVFQPHYASFSALRFGYGYRSAAYFPAPAALFFGPPAAYYYAPPVAYYYAPPAAYYYAPAAAYYAPPPQPAPAQAQITDPPAYTAPAAAYVAPAAVYAEKAPTFYGRAFAFVRDYLFGPAHVARERFLFPGRREAVLFRRIAPTGGRVDVSVRAGRRSAVEVRAHGVKVDVRRRR